MSLEERFAVCKKAEWDLEVAILQPCNLEIFLPRLVLGIISAVLAFLHRLSAVFFYLLGLSFFAAYILWHNEIQAAWAAWWLRVGDLPLILTSLLFGGISFYRSLANPKKPSRMLGGVVTGVMMVLFVMLVALDFGPLWLR